MSFITKRERVFNEYDLFDLPPRNEGKLKAYASCTDSRAWSHFNSDKAEHLFEVIKRNNETCRPKYIPTDVIVNTLMVTKNAEISRLKRQIEEFEQMLAAYDQLELTSEQKCEIANAHDAIKAANKELDDLCLDLDLSGFTEGIDSEAFETGQSRGDVPSRHTDHETEKSKGDEWLYKNAMGKESKSNQVGNGSLDCVREVSTSARDPRLEELQETVINKDAKLSAMHNKIAVLENDVCEPYCIYAHIYTALEKIFGTLCQNIKYKQYLDLLTAGKDTRGIDIKGKILFKMKVLEKFSLALVAPCTEDLTPTKMDCTCYRTEIKQVFALTAADSTRTQLDDKRAHLVADIIENREMKEILSKESVEDQSDIEQAQECFGFDSYSTEAESVNRLKKLQANFEDLLLCYDNLKHEKDCLFLRCQKYTELEKECECMQNRLKEYNQLWSEKEYYRKRSTDLDNLKESYYILTEETTNLETKLKAEIEINKIKSIHNNELYNENVSLEKKIQELNKMFEKENNYLTCKVKEQECKIMCQEQQIKTLSNQIDQFLEQGHDAITSDETARSMELLNEIESQKEQIKNLKDALLCNEEEKRYLEDDFQNKLELINDLKVEIENWKEKYEKMVHANDYLEKCSDDFQDQVQHLQHQNQYLENDLVSKNTALNNLMDIVQNKSQEISNLTNQIEEKQIENSELYKEIKTSQVIYNESLSNLANENQMAIVSLKEAQRESQEILEAIKSFVNINNSNISVAFDDTIEKCKKDLLRIDNDTDSVLIKEIKKLHDLSIQNLHALLDENIQFKESLEVSRHDSLILKNKVESLESLNVNYNKLKESYDKLKEEKDLLERESNSKNFEFELTKKKSEQLMKQLNETEDVRNDFVKLKSEYHGVLQERNELMDKVKYNENLVEKKSEELMKQLNETEDVRNYFVKLKSEYQEVLQERNELMDKVKHNENLLETIRRDLDDLKEENETYLEGKEKQKLLEQELINYEKLFKNLENENTSLKEELSIKSGELIKLRNDLEDKIRENNNISDHINSLHTIEMSLQNDISNMQAMLIAAKKENADLETKLHKYKNLETDIDNIRSAYDGIVNEKENLEKVLQMQQQQVHRLQEENKVLTIQNKDLLDHSEDLQNSLVRTRSQASIINPPNDLLENIRNEIKTMKEEKLISHRNIRDLKDKLDEADDIIQDLKESLAVRDSKIATLQNYANQLEEEVRNLNFMIATAVESSEEIRDNSHKKIDESLRRLEAHHSKATHNMRMEITRLKSDNTQLESQLSNTIINTDVTSREKEKYAAQISQLRNERESLIENIEQLELTCFGDSYLNSDSCSIDEILLSLSRIRKCIESRNLKSSSLENTLMKVQNSSQVLLSKADEAKKIAEKEKEKITLEKEEALKEKITMEQQLATLEIKLKDQINKDLEIIEDLNGKLLNQKLMFERINESTQNYIGKLENEIENLQILYKDSLSKLNELQEKLNKSSENNSNNDEVISDIKRILNEKQNEINQLQIYLTEIQNKPSLDAEMQTIVFINFTDATCQTDDNEIEMVQEPYYYDTNNYNGNVISAGNVTEDNINYIKSRYLDYKSKQLSLGKLELHSISSPSCSKNSRTIEDYDNIENFSENNVSLCKEIEFLTFENHHKIIDIYNTQSILTENTELSSKSFNMGSNGEFITGEYKKCEITEQTNKTDKIVNAYASNENESVQFETNELFLIYEDSDNPPIEYKKKGSSQVVVEILTTNPRMEYKDYNNSNIQKLKINEESDRHLENTIKPKLEVTLPRVDTDETTAIPSSVLDKISVKSLDIFRLPKRLTNSDTKINKKFLQNEISSNSSSINLNNRGMKDLLKIPQNNSEIIKKSINNSIPDQNTRSNDLSYVQNTLSTALSISRNDVLTKESITKTILTTGSSNNKNEKQNIFSENVSYTKNIEISNQKLNKPSNYALEYILDSIKQDIKISNFNGNNDLKNSKSFDQIHQSNHYSNEHIDSKSYNRLSPFLGYTSTEPDLDTEKSNPRKEFNSTQYSNAAERALLVRRNPNISNEQKIEELAKAIKDIENHYKKKIEMIKTQYDNNIKNIMNQHNHGVVSIQNLHEEALQDAIKRRESEIESLRTMSIEGMRKVEMLEKENKFLKVKLEKQQSNDLSEVGVKRPSTEPRKRKHRHRMDRILTKTNIESFNLSPKSRSHGPCTCSLDLNLSDTIRNIFEQVDVEQRKLGEQAYTKYIVNKIIETNIDALDTQELAFLHLTVCRTWKAMLGKEEALQKRIDSLESDLFNKQRRTQKHIADLDRKVAEERRRLQEVREAVCRNTTIESCENNPERQHKPEKDVCKCVSKNRVEEKCSGGDVVTGVIGATLRAKRPKQENNRAVSAKLGQDERREKKHYYDDQPVRLRRTDRATRLSHKKY
ncbi:putative leucine-rich repeat-containing protein DDB_G0290503 isoform X2 [Leptidea sinapis]|uniref:putative leucine-rich repeat-containing protein DDB_G0290503 isoform X2 n=1 Tax=Leptidea sinapis TaxID=189913 RepID=UPI0021C37FBF|nr:putative leucine-rich repeat-containing protein DDB_G0290503 isoform X2 [Leptidea sinapis]